VSNDDRWDDLPESLPQNPSPFPETGQEYLTDKQSLVDGIVQAFLSLLPSNYVSMEKGPWYTLQFQSIAESLAEFQITAQEVFKDNDWDFTRPDFLWEILGTLVFPGADQRSGVPNVDGGVTYRTFLQRMVILFLQGATADTMEEGAELLTDAQVTLLEKFLDAADRNPVGEWTIDNQFEVEIFTSAEDGTEFPELPFILQSNVALIEDALKPAHVLYSYQFLFLELYGTLFEDSSSWTLERFHYDDLRHYCYGAREVTGTAGKTLTDTTLFSDVTVTFRAIRAGSILRLDTGSNAGSHVVSDVRYFPVGDDTTARAYTTSPSSLAGYATVASDVVTDSSQDWALAEEGEVLTFTEGPNAGEYRLDTLLGSGGGPLGSALAVGPATQVRVSPCLLRLQRRMTAAATGQAYTVEADRMGFRTPKVVTGEDAAEQFYL
jgi:hypothetical protein